MIQKKRDNIEAAEENVKVTHTFAGFEGSSSRCYGIQTTLHQLQWLQYHQMRQRNQYTQHVAHQKQEEGGTLTLVDKETDSQYSCI